MEEKDREYIINLIKNSSPAIQDIAALAFALGHEEGWWLNRTDPDVNMNPLDHSRLVNPFKVTDPGVQMILGFVEQEPHDPQIP